MTLSSPHLRGPYLLVVLALALLREDAVGDRELQPAPKLIRSCDAVTTCAGNAQHTAIFNPAAQHLNRIRWSTPIDLNNTGAQAHYGAPLITAANTVITPVKIAGNLFQVKAFDGAAGAAKYTLATDYILPPHNWIPMYQPALADGSAGSRLYFPGAGGTVFFIDGPDSNSPGAPVRRVFYTNLADYEVNAAAFNASVFINTPITADSGGNIFFGFRMVGTAPAPLSTPQGGFARIAPDGNATYVLAGTAANDPAIGRDSDNSAPALSNDEQTLYVVVKSATSDSYAYLLGLDTATLARKYRVFLKDPRNADNAVIIDASTASPTVAPDNDVYFGVLAGPSFLLRFSSDLTVEKAPGAFGWDNTAAIVPREMVPSYTGTSSYLIFSKYNNYATVGGSGENGVNKIAILDPGSTEVNPRDPSSNTLVMREVLTMAGPTPDAGHPTIPTAVREWCINTAAVNPPTNSVFTPSEDGHLYRWDLATNSLSQAVRLTAGIGEPYVPTVIGPDGTVYTLNGGTLFALGGVDGVRITLSSSVPGDRAVVAGQPLAFTVAVTNAGPPGNTPSGTVTFQDTVYFVAGPDDLQSTTTVLAAGVVLDGAGHASCNTSALASGTHFIAVLYSGDGNFSAGGAVLVQRIHARASSTALVSSLNPSAAGEEVTFTATVASVPPGSGTPTGMVTFQDGPDALAQIPLNGGGAASFSLSALSVRAHTITAMYVSDPRFASSGGSLTQVIQNTATAPVIALQQIASSLGSVTSITNAGDSRLFLTIQSGKVLIFNGGSVLPSPFLDVTPFISCCGERGLLSVAFHPQYASNGFLFVYATDVAGNIEIARYRRSVSDPNAADPSSRTVLLTIPHPINGNHNGGQLQFGPEGFLYIGTGDGGSANDPPCNAQNDDSPLGKMLRIDVDQNVNTPPFYGVPSSNPMAGQPFPRNLTWAKGLRNPFRFSFDRMFGDLWIGDVGQNAWEEVDFQPSSSTGGENYGWKIMEGNHCGADDSTNCPTNPAPPPCGSPLFRYPVYEYGHTGGDCSIIGGYVYRGTRDPSLYGSYVYGDLCTGHLWINGRLQTPTAPGLQTFGQGSDGELYAATGAGQLFRLTHPNGPTDFNGDGKTDLVWRNVVSGLNGIWLMNGTVPTSVNGLITVSDTNWEIASAGDFNGDGSADLLWRNKVNGSNAFWLMSGTSFSSIVNLPAVTDVNWRIVATGDFNGDGQRDIVWRNSVSGQNGIWLMNGTVPAAVVPLVTVTDTTWTIAGAGDFNGDGKSDLVWRNTVSGLNGIWLMDGNSVTSVVGLPTVDSGWVLAAVGDFNGDGDADLVWRSASSGIAGIWLMSGTTASSVVGLPAVSDLNWRIAAPR